MIIYIIIIIYALKYIFINVTLNSIYWYNEIFEYHIQAFVKSIFVEREMEIFKECYRNSQKMDSIVQITI